MAVVTCPSTVVMHHFIFQRGKKLDEHHRVREKRAVLRGFYFLVSGALLYVPKALSIQ